jgi:hypothetical protein
MEFDSNPKSNNNIADNKITLDESLLNLVQKSDPADLKMTVDVSCSSHDEKQHSTLGNSTK